MATIRHHARIDRSADDVWAVVSDFGGVADWFPSLDSSSSDGTTRTCVAMGGAMTLTEELVTSDDELRRLQYSLVGDPPPLDFHLATVDVLPDGDGSLVVYSTDMRPDDLAELIDGTLASGLQGLKEHLEG
jgi:hypothetical protein